MPTVTVRKHDLERLLGHPITLTALDEALPLVKAELDKKTKDGEELRDSKGRWIEKPGNLALRIELNDTNRPDTWTAEGIARQLRDHESRIPEPRSYTCFASAPSSLKITVSSEMEELRPYVGGFIVETGAAEGITEDALLAFIEVQEVLTRNYGKKRAEVSIGIYDAASLAFPISYAAIDRNQGAFEPLAPAGELAADWHGGRALSPAEILEQHPTGREYAFILSGRQRVPMLTDASGAVLSFPPIINSAKLGRVKAGMKKLFVEVTGTHLDHGVLALNIMAANFVDRGWQVRPVTTEYPYDTPMGRQVTAPRLMEQTQSLAASEFSRLLGDKVSPEEILSELRRFGVRAKAEADGRITATIASYRADYLHPVDVIEDFAISRGLESFTPQMPSEATVGRLTPLTDFEDHARELLIACGFAEAIGNILSREDELRGRMNIDPTQIDMASLKPFHGEKLVSIKNIMNENYAVLRDSLLPTLLTIEGRSSGTRYPHKIFEAGEVQVFDREAELGSRTELRCAAAITAERATFDEAQQVVYTVLETLGLKTRQDDFAVRAWDYPAFIPGHSALVSIKGEAIGIIGELHPKVLQAFKINMPVVAFELRLDAIMASCKP